MLRLARIGLLAIAAMLIGCGGSGSDQKKAVDSKSPCQAVPAAKPRPELARQRRPATVLPEGSVWDATVTTNCGSFTVRIDSAISPKAAASFVQLAQKGFYDGLSFHRLAPGFVIQGGDPLGDGTGGPGYTTVDRPSDGQLYPRGTVAMAKSADQPPGAAGSQFFVVTGEDAQLPPDYAVLGEVSKGERTLDLITLVGVDPSGQVPNASADGRPAKPIVIESVKLSRAG